MKDKIKGGVYKSISELVGNTPLVELTNYEKANKLEAAIIGKLEYFNPLSSVKDRIALSMIEAAEASGKLTKDTLIVEGTSGNTGIGLAAYAAAKGYKFRVYVQDTVSEERFKIMRAFGADTRRLFSVPAVAKVVQETHGDIVAAFGVLDAELQKEARETGLKYILLNQTANPANPDIHRATTGPEIWEDTKGKLDILVASSGTGGTITGAGEYLKSKNPNIKVVVVQPGPNTLPTPDGKFPDRDITGVHPVVGVPESFLPKTLNRNIYDEVIAVEADEAYATARKIAKADGILVGASSGATVYAATDLARRPENKGKTIVAILPDSGFTYLSTDMFNQE
jgi:cysteine synthase A